MNVKNNFKHLKLIKMKILFTLLFSFVTLFVFGQQKASFACSFFGTDVGANVLNGQGLSFSSNSEAERIIDKILLPTGLKRNFIIQQSNEVANAAAIVHGQNRYILYNNDFMKMVDNSTKTDWASVSILAHETGHHLNGHTLQAGGSRPDIELEADDFSGFVLYKLGASLQDAQKAMSTLASEQASSTHPGKFQRLQAIQKGWSRAASQSSNTTTSSSTSTNTSSNTSSSSTLESNIEFKGNIKSAINSKFHKWANRWSVDRYIDDTNSINSFTKEGNEYVIRGNFKVSRSLLFASQTVSVSYTAKVSATAISSFEIISLCYNDSSSGQSDCY